MFIVPCLLLFLTFLKIGSLLTFLSLINAIQSFLPKNNESLFLVIIELTMVCPLCSSKNSNDYAQDDKREFYRCIQCDLIFVDPKYWPEKSEEKRIYDQHQNHPADQGYRKFLSQLSDPMIERLKLGAKGLDFGCGPGPTLSVLFEERAFKMNLYDPFYFANEEVLREEYDFITCTEVFEHLQSPMKELELLLSLLKSGGLLGLMTKMTDEVRDFPSWYYKNDMTHICFYSKNTFRYLAKRFFLGLDFYGDNTIIFSSP